MPEELCQVSPKSHYGVLASHSDPSPFEEVMIFGVSQGATTDPLEEVLIFSTLQVKTHLKPRQQSEKVIILIDDTDKCKGPVRILQALGLLYIP